MYNIVFRCIVSATVKLYSNTVVQPLQYKYVFEEFKFSVPKYSILPRGFCTNKSYLIQQEYDKKFEEELNEYLKDPQNAANFEKCQLEVEYLRSSVDRVPKSLKAQNWLHLLKSNFRGQRRAYLAYLWQIEKKEENRILKKEQRKKLIIEKRNAETSENKYKLSYNTMFHRIREQAIMQFYNGRLINAMLWAPTIVFDLGYDEYMTQNEKQQCAKQLLYAFSQNRLHDDPCNLYFCNTDLNSITMKQLHKTIPTLYDADFPLNITTKSYLDIFDKSKLVYLTPHTRKVLTHYDADAIYIIGAMIDKTNHEPLSMQKARREGIKMVKFPLSEKLPWGTGSIKNLPLNQVLSILLDLRVTNNWEIALQHIPRRKLKENRLKSLERQVRKREELISSLLQNV
ncbi:tRNA methyltransferase roswell [Megachile rotundata]|uniref:tRNA methyltransferase roswell n=1 Tax=Megachile rotundata TaxID=143995 RepID=UPI000258D664|nr:PREDICTED: mitochondrial ribonuclease P protein 1 homolog [Megachile rotundata]